MKRSAALCLGLALFAAPYPSHAQQTGPKPQILPEIVCGLLVIGGGIYVGVQLWKLCNKIPGPGTSNPPPNGANTNNAALAPTARPALILNDAAVNYVDVSANDWADPVTGTSIQTAFKFTLLTSTDCVAWTLAATVEGWSSATGTTLLYRDPAGTPLATNYMRLGETNYCPANIGTGTEPRRFYRVQ